MLAGIAQCGQRQHRVSNETMTAASHIVRKRAKDFLAVLVAILFLFAPMAGAAPMDCGTHTVGSQHAVSSQFLHADSKPYCPKACCMSVCSLCYALSPAPMLIEAILKSAGRRDLTLQRPIVGISSRPAIGPPRSAG